MTDPKNTTTHDDLTSWPPMPLETAKAFLDALTAFENMQQSALRAAQAQHLAAMSDLERELAAQRSVFRNQLQVVFAGGPGSDD